MQVGIGLMATVAVLLLGLGLWCQWSDVFTFVFMKLFYLICGNFWESQS